MKFKENIIDSNYLVSNALEKLDKLSQKVLFVVNKNNKLLGTITDSDIRSFYLKKNNFDTKVKNIINRYFYFFYQSKKRSIIKKNVRWIPILNHAKKIVKILDTKSKKNLKNNVVIIAGGKGKRLGKLTRITPKPMITYNNKPHLHELIENLVQQGLKNINICLNYKHKFFINYFKNIKTKANLNFIIEKTPLGTAGSLSNLNLKNNLPIIVMNADIHTNLNFSNLIDFHNENKSEFTICIKKNTYVSKYGEILIKDNKITNIKEKPKKTYFFNSGIYILNNKIIKNMKKNEKIEMNDLIIKNIKNKTKITPFYLHEKWVDFGNKRDLNRLKKNYSL